MLKIDIVVVGGSAAGIPAAVTARRHYPEKTICVVRKENKVLIPCGIPYIFGTVGSPDKNLIPDMVLEKNKIDLLIAEVDLIDREKKIIQTTTGEVAYDKLILAMGSLPVMPPIPGIELNGVFSVIKDVERMLEIQKSLKKADDVVVIGGGFIGIEFADEIKKSGVKNVTIVEIASHCLSLAYDDEFCIEMEKHLSERGVEIMTSTKVESITGRCSVEGVILSDGNALQADVVILGIGAVPSSSLAEKSGLKLSPQRAIEVDRHMRTSDSSVFACGDCVQKTSFFDGKPSALRLASIATFEARIAGANLFGIKRESIGTVGVWSTAVGDLAMGTAGFTEKAAEAEGYEIVVSVIDGPNRHPGCMPGSQNMTMKLLFEKCSGVLLGGQVMGDASIGEVINTLSACIQKKMTAEDLAMFQTGTHPALTASPVAYPLVNAAEMALASMKKESR